MYVYTYIYTLYRAHKIAKTVILVEYCTNAYTQYTNTSNLPVNVNK